MSPHFVKSTFGGRRLQHDNSVYKEAYLGILDEATAEDAQAVAGSSAVWPRQTR